MPALRAPERSHPGEAALLARLRRRDPRAAREVIKANNQRLFRVAWSVLKDRPEAEEVVQESYLKGFSSIARFNGDSSLSTWLTRIVLNEAISRRRAARRRLEVVARAGVAFIEEYREAFMRGSAEPLTADQGLSRRQVAGALQRAIGRLPEKFRLVFVMREIEELSVEETAHLLGIPPQTVKSRLHRAKGRLRSWLDPEIQGALAEVALFAGADCEALTCEVLARLRSRPAVADGRGNLRERAVVQ